MDDKRFQSRKFILACAAFLAGTSLLVAGLISADQFISLTVWVVGLYSAANVAQKATTK